MLRMIRDYVVNLLPVDKSVCAIICLNTHKLNDKAFTICSELSDELCLAREVMIPTIYFPHNNTFAPLCIKLAISFNKQLAIRIHDEIKEEFKDIPNLKLYYATDLARIFPEWEKKVTCTEHLSGSKA